MYNSKVLIKFTDNLVYESTDNLTSIGINEELAYTSGSNPLGSISTNTLSFKLSNNEGLLCPTNVNSPYYGYMEEGAEVCVYVNTSGTGFNLFGTFYVKSWGSGTGDYGFGPVDITCIDWLGLHKDDVININSMPSNIGIHQFITLILESIGCDNYVIDESIPNNILNFGILNATKLGECLSVISSSCLLYVYVNRSNQLCFYNSMVNSIGNSVYPVLDGIKNVYKGRALDTTKNYGRVQVDYKGYTKSDKKSLHKVDNYELKAGTNTIDLDITAKIYSISSVIIRGNGVDTYIKNISYTQNSIQIVVTSNIASKVSLEVFGCDLTEASSSVVGDTNNSKKDTYSISSELIQTKEYATYIKDTLIQFFNYGNNIITLNTDVSPTTKIGDILSVCVSSIGANGVYLVMGLKFTFGDNYRCEVTLRKIKEV